MTGIDGKILVITGAASGIGAATALGASQNGAAGLVLVDLNEQGVREVAEQLTDRGTPVETMCLDVTEDKSAELIVECAVKKFGRLDAAANVAGITVPALSIVECPDEVYDRVLLVNLRSMFCCVRAQLRQMYVQGSGSIVNVGSASTLGVWRDMAPYVVAKAGVVALTKAASKEAGLHGVRVNSVCPGFTETPMASVALADGDSDRMAGFLQQIPLGRTGQAPEQANAILWLCSDESSFVTGANLVVDGGRTG